jgi:hypothetical protein
VVVKDKAGLGWQGRKVVGKMGGLERMRKGREGWVGFEEEKMTVMIRAVGMHNGRSVHVLLWRLVQCILIGTDGASSAV